ncbi:hypothetical protein [Streptomyces sp. NPDC051014]|uniref:hypothetical protein n=1 Tax=Streptomyces sp. NPDC051014 TaxID=3155751 RepID=UPI0033F9D561
MEWLDAARWGRWDVAAVSALEVFGWLLDQDGARAVVRVLGEHHGVAGFSDEDLAGRLVNLALAGSVDFGVAGAGAGAGVGVGVGVPFGQLGQLGQLGLGGQRGLGGGRDEVDWLWAPRADGGEVPLDPAWECLQAMGVGDWQNALGWAGLWCPGAVVDRLLLEACLNLTAQAAGVYLSGVSCEADAAAFGVEAASRPACLEIWRQQLPQLTGAGPVFPDAGTAPPAPHQPHNTNVPAGPGMDMGVFQQGQSPGPGWYPLAGGTGADGFHNAPGETHTDSTPPDVWADIRLTTGEREVLGAIVRGHRTFDAIAKDLHLTTVQARSRLRYLADRVGFENGSLGLLKDLLTTLTTGEGVWATIDIHTLPAPAQSSDDRVVRCTKVDREILGAIARGHHTVDALGECFHISSSDIRSRLSRFAGRAWFDGYSEDFLAYLVRTLTTRKGVWATIDMHTLPTPEQGAARTKERSAACTQERSAARMNELSAHLGKRKPEDD